MEMRDISKKPPTRESIDDSSPMPWRDPVTEGNPYDTSYASYMAPLVACLAASEGPVLELGIGNWSTPFLHRYCMASGRQLISYDEDPKWIESFLQYRVGNQHLVERVHYDAAVHAHDASPWGVVLMDHSPGWRRAADALLFKGSAQFILVHDFSGQEVVERFTPDVLSQWNFAAVAEFSPSTLVLSNEFLLFPKRRGLCI